MNGYRQTVRSVTMGQLVVTKRNRPELMAIEVEKTRRGHDIALRHGLFRVPAVRSFDAQTGVAEFERVTDVLPLRRRAREVLQHEELAELLASVLATIHRELLLPPEMHHPLPEGYRDDRHASVCLHGDYTGYNILVSPSLEVPVVTDWLTSSRVGDRVTIGSPMFDVFWFIRWWYLIPDVCMRGGNAVDSFCRRFVLSYASQSGGYVLPQAVGEYTIRTQQRDVGRRNAGAPRYVQWLWLIGDRRLRRLGEALQKVQADSAHGKETSSRDDQ